MPKAPQNPPNSYLPRLPGVGPEVQRVVQDLWTAVRDSVAQTQNLIERPTWTKTQLDAKYSAAVVAQALSYGGPNQLNVNGLPGLLLQPQTAAVTPLTAVPTNTPGSDPLNQTGSLISVNGQLMVYSGTAWVALTVLGSVLQDTHANRTNYPAADYALGVLYHETDRTVFYEVQLVGGVNTWVYSFGVMYAASSSRPVLTANDVNFLLLQTDNHLLYYWDGTDWIYASGVMFGNSTFLPAGLGAGDFGLPLIAVDNFIVYYWTGVAWTELWPVNSITPAVYGDSANVSQITVDKYGRITAVANVPIVFPGTTGFSGTVTPVVSITVVNGLVTAVS
jgi:hypothetical protein